MTRESQAMNKYKRLGCENIGTQSGTTKFIYIDTETGQRVAFHSLVLRPGPSDGDPNNKEFGVPLMTVREVSFHKVLDHENVARLVNIDYDPGDGFVRLIFEYPGMNLIKFLKEHPVKAGDPKLIKKLLHQLLSGIAYYHSIKAAHRNLNARNVLIDLENDKLKITNFPLDINVECHKAPELLMGSNLLSLPADMFACGCLFGEMMKKAPLFRGSSDAARRLSIFNLLGTPSEENWPDAILQYGDPELEKIEPKELKEVFPGLEEDGLDLLSKLLCLDPVKRITAADSLKHPYFKDVKD